MTALYIWSVTALFWAALCYVSGKVYKQRIIEHGWLENAKKYNLNKKWCVILFILLMYIPVVRVFQWCLICAMAENTPDELQEKFKVG